MYFISAKHVILYCRSSMGQHEWIRAVWKLVYVTLPFGTSWPAGDVSVVIHDSPNKFQKCFLDELQR